MKKEGFGDAFSAESLAARPTLAALRPWLHDPTLYRVTRRSVACAMAIGLALMWVPLPIQTLLASAVAIQLRANLPLSAGLVWITNPLTVPPMYYGAYQLGSSLIGPADLDTQSWSTLLHDAQGLWLPLLTGCGVLAVTFAILGYTATHLVWRARAVYRLAQRRARKSP